MKRNRLKTNNINAGSIAINGSLILMRAHIPSSIKRARPAEASTRSMCEKKPKIKPIAPNISRTPVNFLKRSRP